jgi:transposase
MLVRVNTIDTKWDNAVVPLEVTWETFRDVILSGHTIADAKEGVKLFNASEYKPLEALGGDGNFIVYDEANDQFRARRLADNVVAVTMLILDYDGGMSLQSARERFKDYEYVAYTSFSHRREKDVDRYRMVFPLASPIPADAMFSPFDNLIQGSEWHELEEALKEFAGPCDPVLDLTRRLQVDTSLSHSEVFNMSKKGKRYTVEFRYQIVQLVRAGRAIPELCKEFGVSIWSIRNWVKQAARDAGTGDQGLTSLEREELTRLKHEVRQLRQEREILSKAAAWFARENIEIPKRSSDS